MTVTAQDAQRVAEQLARGAGGTHRPYVAEFPECFIVWTLPDSAGPPEPGAGARLVIDRQDARVSTYPSVPLEHVRRLHRQHRAAQEPAAQVTADPAAALRRLGGGFAPGVAVRLVPGDGLPRETTGAKGDQVLHHHPLVVKWLAMQSPGSLVRGTRRHAELIVLSDWLHELEQAAVSRGEPGLGIAQVRTAAQQVQELRLTLVRDPGDPLAGTPAGPCDTCLAAWIHFGLAPASAAVGPVEPVAPPTGIPGPLANLSPDVAATLAAGGWDVPLRLDGRIVSATEWAELSVRALGEYGHPPLEPLRAAIEKFPYLVSVRRGPGVAHWVRPFELGGDLVGATAASLADFGRVIGTELAPIGAEQAGDAIIAVDANGQVWVLDQAGEWYAGPDLDTAFVVLLQGHPMPRVRDDGTLEPPA
ncbi:SUKH-3 domain-containing protein [Catellatospora paridis]|uniref:SUKH-3 domain-containing protein n=1 Tax=Catellatospora paridis TaxID=1617086 RepID=UPI0012D4C192|nr:SUKH-3 domain-containing protein [Catellatospora paridis]